VASALNLILAQRLLRRICSSCKEKYDVSDEELEAAKVKRTTKLKELRFTSETIENAKARATPEAAPYLAKLTVDSTIADLAFFKGKGCDKCGGTGMRGRQGVYEVMAMTPGVRKSVMSNAGASEIKDVAVSEGMLTLRMDAWMKVMKGITTMEQMIRETSA
jgi:type IV pilus assembly protein PilB